MAGGRRHRVLACMVLCAALAACAPSEQFEWAVSPKAATIAPGGVATFDVVVRSKHDIESKVFLRSSSVPPNATAVFEPAVMPSTATTSTLTIQTTGQTGVGAYEIEIFAREEGFDEDVRKVDLLLSASQGNADFALAVDPGQFTFGEPESKTFAYRVTPLNGFHGEVAVEVSGLSDDLVLTQPPTAVTVGEGGFSSAGATFVVSFQKNGPVGPEMVITVTATGGGISHARTIAIRPPQSTAAPSAAAPSGP